MQNSITFRWIILMIIVFFCEMSHAGNHDNHHQTLSWKKIADNLWISTYPSTLKLPQNQQQIFAESQTGIAFWDNEKTDWVYLSREGFNFSPPISTLIAHQNNYYATLPNQLEVYHYDSNEKKWLHLSSGLTLKPDEIYKSHRAPYESMRLFKNKQNLFLLDDKEAFYVLNTENQTWEKLIQFTSDFGRVTILNEDSLYFIHQHGTMDIKLPIAELLAQKNHPLHEDQDSDFFKQYKLTTYSRSLLWDTNMPRLSKVESIFQPDENSDDYYEYGFDDNGATRIIVRNIRDYVEIAIPLPDHENTNVTTMVNCGKDVYLLTNHGEVLLFNLEKQRLDSIFKSPVDINNHLSRLLSYQDHLYFFTHENEVYQSSTCNK